MFGDNLKKCRMEAGISQKELSMRLNVSQQTVGSWEVNRTSPSPETLSAIAKALNISTDYLLGRDSKKSPTSAALSAEDAELVEYLEELKTRPEMRMLFSLSKGATKKDVEDAVRIIQALRDGRDN